MAAHQEWDLTRYLTQYLTHYLIHQMWDLTRTAHTDLPFAILPAKFLEVVIQFFPLMLANSLTSTIQSE